MVAGFFESNLENQSCGLHQGMRIGEKWYFNFDIVRVTAVLYRIWNWFLRVWPCPTITTQTTGSLRWPRQQRRKYFPPALLGHRNLRSRGSATDIWHLGITTAGRDSQFLPPVTASPDSPRWRLRGAEFLHRGSHRLANEVVGLGVGVPMVRLSGRR